MDIHSNSMESLIGKIAEKYNITRREVRDIVLCEFEVVKKQMKKVDSYNDSWPYIRLANLGLFEVKDGKKRFFRNKSKKIIEECLFSAKTTK